MADQIFKEIEKKVESNKGKRHKDPNSSYELGMELLFSTKKQLDELRSLLGENDARYMLISDQLAKEALQCGIDYFKAMKDNSRFSESNSLEILNSAKDISNNAQTISRINDNIEGIHDWVRTQKEKDSRHVHHDFNKILLKTAFSFMTCDGHIDPNEVSLIIKMAEKDKRFGEIDINKELDLLIEGINAWGIGFLKEYIKILRNAKFSHEQELDLVDMSIKTLYADGRVDYNEIKFFRIFRSLLDVSDAQIKEKCPDLSDEFFETDIFPHSYLKLLFEDYFDKIELPQFEKLSAN